jgi:hypothetical protein
LDILRKKEEMTSFLKKRSKKRLDALAAAFPAKARHQ